MIFRFSWLHSKGYLQGIFWMILASCVSSLNDVLTKYVGARLSGSEVAFFRFFFSTLVLFPFMFIRGKGVFVTSFPGVQCIRAVLLVLGMITWSYGVACIPLTLATTISFTTPLFVLPLAKIFLNERVGRQRWTANFFGFIGILISIQPTGNADAPNSMVFMLVLSTIIFAFLDIINKKLLIEDESLLSMLFYSGLGAALLGFIPAFLTWNTPTLMEFFFLSFLGGGGSLLLFFLLKAFLATNVSALQSFRYSEFILSVFFGFIVFQELPTINIILGIIIISVTTFYIAIYENYTQRNPNIEGKLELKKNA